jgi:HlyD family secretion protein
MRKRIILYGTLLLVALAIGYGYMPKPVGVEVTSVKRGELKVTVDEEGKTRVIDRFVISAPVAGFSRRVALDVGDLVKRGSVIAELEPQRSRVLDPRSKAEAKARVSAAKAALSAAEARSMAAKADSEYEASELARVKELYSEGFVSKDELEATEAKARRTAAYYRSESFAVEVARFELEAAETALKYSTGKMNGKNSERVAVRAPISGRVLKIHHRSEGVIAEGAAIVELGDPRALEIEAELLSADSVKLVEGTEVVFTRWGGDEPLFGRVKLIEPAGFTKVSALGVEEQRVLVISEITSPAKLWERLGDGYRVEASFILWKGEDVLQVPTSALFRQGQLWGVFVMDGNRAKLREVKLGRRSGLVAEIKNGLDEGEKVIVHPDDAITDNTKVRLR